MVVGVGLEVEVMVTGERHISNVMMMASLGLYLSRICFGGHCLPGNGFIRLVNTVNLGKDWLRPAGCCGQRSCDRRAGVRNLPLYLTRQRAQT